MRWCERHPDARTVPDFLYAQLDNIKRYDAIETMPVNAHYDAVELEHINDVIYADIAPYSARRAAEQSLAIYIDHVASSQLQPELYDLAQKLTDCRIAGAVGILPDARNIIAWDNKCGQAKLCPDESRTEAKRLTSLYYPEIMHLKKSSPFHRVFYAVFTVPNYPRGELLSGQKDIFDRFKTWSAGQDAVIGSLVIQESPLSKHDDWNVHLNVYLITHGAFDYQQAAAKWGFNVEFIDENRMCEIASDRLEITNMSFTSALRYSLRESIKYCVQTVPEKSDQHFASGHSDAPAMTDWPHDVFWEWWSANKRFRRVRSYGRLFNAPKKQWTRSSTREQVEIYHNTNLAEPARWQPGIPVGDVAGKDWDDLSIKIKTALRRAMLSGKPINKDLIKWMGTVAYEDGRYSVGLILGDKSRPNLSRFEGINFDCTNMGHGP